ncbi:MAG: NAD(P)H-hydrate dehydratase [Bacteroidales bacterium]|nr:NAD(P)H-hydrate dehydratase [Bacteroidales bacterium]
MKIPTIKNAREADAFTIENEPITSVDLMERAAATAFGWIENKLSHQTETEVKIFCGMGNNGGDGFVLGRLFCQKHYDVEVFLVHVGEKMSHDCQVNYERLKSLNPSVIHGVSSKNDFPEISDSDVVIDAMFGSGLTRPLEGLAAEMVEHLNNNQAVRMAIDIASGLNGDGFSTSKYTFRPDYTLSFQFPKLAFLLPENEPFVGNWEVLDIKIHPDYVEKVESVNFLTESEIVKPLVHRRGKHSHKGTYGHALLIAGSTGKTGAALLAAESCLRSGVGLLTAHLPKSATLPLQVYLPEAMMNVDESEDCFSQLPDLLNYTAIAAGPGLGKRPETANALKRLIQETKVPVVLDADALNIISENKTWLAFLPERTIMTPHPKEFERLFGKTENSLQRLELQREMSCKYNLIIVLKGANTAVTFPTGACFFNTTGNPGMATAGSGDVLTGIILSLVAQRYTPEEAALLGVYLHGMAGDIAASENGMESLIASDISKNIGKAFRKLSL